LEPENQLLDAGAVLLGDENEKWSRLDAASLTTEEIVRVGGGGWLFLRIKGGDGEHLTRPFAIAGSYNRSVDLNEVLLVKKLINGHGQTAANSHDGTNTIGPWPQVIDLSEKFKGMPLLLQRPIAGKRFTERNILPKI